jgi:DNA topoisomerase VI subunit A
MRTRSFYSLVFYVADFWENVCTCLQILENIIKSISLILLDMKKIMNIRKMVVFTFLLQGNYLTKQYQILLVGLNPALFYGS